MARRVTKKTKKPSTKLKAQGRGGLSPEQAAAERPTPEMEARVEYRFGPVKTEMNVQVGSAYRRQPLFLTMAKKADRFTASELLALTVYRNTFDRCERSPMASCLAERAGGGRGVGPAGFIHASPAIVEAKRKLALLERGLGPYLATMRAVVLRDESFSAIAMERYGCRTRSWIRVDEPLTIGGRPAKVGGEQIHHSAFREDVVPRSGRDREKVAAEFNRGVKLLALSAARLQQSDIHELWVQPREDGTAIIHRASVAPNGLFRMWGPATRVAAVLDDLLSVNDGKLTFATPLDARDALIAADDGRLRQLEPDELAA